MFGWSRELVINVVAAIQSLVQTMEPLKYVKAEDRVELSDIPQNGHTLNLDRLPGIWLNTNSSTQGIVKVEIRINGSKLVVRAFAADNLDSTDWGEVEADYIYANGISSPLAAGFTARYDFDVSQTHLQANWNQGLLVLASFTSFKDGSKRSNYFSREFFHR